MKKTLAILLALSLSTLAFAQEDKQIFNHLAAGVTVGEDGVGVEVATTLTPYVQFRAGYSLFIPPRLTFSNLQRFGLPSEATINNETRSLKEVSVGLGMNLGGGKFMADIFPSAHRGFHFTVGAYFGTPNFLSLDADVSHALKQDEYASYGIKLNENDEKTNITSDPQGHLKVDFHTWVVRPYVGIGFGRAIDPEKNVRVTFDLGVMFWGSPYFQSYDYSRYSATGKVTTVPITSATIANNKDLQQAGTVLDVISAIPAYPMFKVNVFFRIL